MRFVKIFVLIIGCFFLCWFCQKKLFERVKVTGRILHASTQEPFGNAFVYLYSDDASSSKSSAANTIQLKASVSNSDGTFRIRSNASKINRYYLWVQKDNGKAPVVLNFEIPDGSTKDLGDILVPW